EVGTNEVGFAEVGTAEVGTAEVGTAEVGTAEVGTAEVGFAEVGIDEIRTHKNMVISPLMPNLHTLPEYINMLLICHDTFPSLCLQITQQSLQSLLIHHIISPLAKISNIPLSH